MSGANQHTVPRFLLNGFASRRRGDEIYVWMTRKGGREVELNTKNVGAERYFYGKPGPDSLDETISRAEGQYAALVKDLQESPTNSAQAERIGRLISHLSLRTRALRQSVAEATRTAMQEMYRFMRSEDMIGKLVRSGFLEREVLAKASEYGVGAPLAQQIWEAMKPEILTKLPEIVAESVPPENLWKSFLDTEFDKTIQSAHIKGLEGIEATDKRAEIFAQLRWGVVPVPAPLILSDVACIFECRGHRRFKPLIDPEDELVSVFLPVTAHQVLVGRWSEKFDHIDSKVLNKASARCSYEYFVSSGPHSNDHLGASIGKWAGVITTQDLAGILEEVKRGFPYDLTRPNSDQM